MTGPVSATRRALLVLVGCSIAAIAGILIWRYRDSIRSKGGPPSYRPVPHVISKCEHTDHSGASHFCSLAVFQNSRAVSARLEVCNLGKGRLGLHLHDRSMAAGFVVVRGREWLRRAGFVSHLPRGPIVWIPEGERVTLTYDLTDHYEFTSEHEFVVKWGRMGHREHPTTQVIAEDIEAIDSNEAPFKYR